MKIRTLLALVLITTAAGCAMHSSREDVLRDAHGKTLRLEMVGGGICSGTAVGPHLVLTATHCFGEGPMVSPAETEALVSVDGKPVAEVKRINDGQDHSLVVVDATFETYASIAEPPKQGDHVFIFGNALGWHDLYREGYMVGVYHEAGFIWTVYDMNTYMGDSGSGVFDDQGRVVAVLSAGFYANIGGGGIKLMAALPLSFTKAQFTEAGYGSDHQ